MTQYNKKRAVFSLLIVFATSLQGARAADVLPGSVAPGRVEQQFKPLKIPKSEGKALVPGQRDLPVPAGAEDSRFLLDGINVTGMTVVSQDEVKPIYADLLGKQASLADLYRVANRITAYYRNKGYILSQAVVPEQEIGADHVATLQLVEGYINNVQITGLDETERSRIARYTDKLKASRPLQAKVLERYLLLVNDLSGVTASATLAKSDVQGAADLMLTLSQVKFQGQASLDNRGSAYIGPGQFTAQGTVNNLSRHFDHLSLTAVTTGNDELAYGFMSYDLPVGSEGLVLHGSAGITRSNPAGNLEPLEIDNRSKTLSLGAKYPVLRSRAMNFSVRGELSAYNGESKRLGSAEGSEILDTEDRVRSVRFGATFDKADRLNGINLLDIELSKGLDGLGASENGSSNLSRENGEIDYLKLNLYAARLQSIVSKWSALFAVNSQFSNDNLLSSEQFGVGGRYFGSAFDASEIVGDSGVAGRFELRYTDSTPLSWFKNYVAYAFVDGGRIERNSPSVGQPDRESLSSAGLGVRFKLNDYWTGYLEYAAPMSHEIASEGNDDPRVFFSIQGYTWSPR